jgi:hypothetical protein
LAFAQYVTKTLAAFLGFLAAGGVLVASAAASFRVPGSHFRDYGDATAFTFAELPKGGRVTVIF